MPPDPLNVDLNAVDWPAIAGRVASLIVTLWVLGKFIFEPRLRAFLEGRISAKTQDFEEDFKKMSIRIAHVEQESLRSEQTIKGVTEALGRLTRSIEHISKDLAEQGREVSYIAGTIRGRAPRSHSGEEDDDAQ